MTAGKHDHPGIYPTLPGREMNETDRMILAANEGNEWETCWEFVLSHQLTEAEGSAFWHGANLAMKAAKNG